MFQKFCFLLILGLAFPSTFAQSCPPADQLAPCECEEDELFWMCDAYAHPDLDLKEVFDRVSPLIGENVIFNHLQITDIPSAVLAADTMTSLKFKSITLEYNDFRFIHPDAFNATYEVTTYLSIGDNKLSNDENSQDNFEFVRRFKNLETLAIMRNSLKSIPSEPFGDALPNLHTLEVGQCYNGGLEQVGSRVLANLPNLKIAQFRYCHINETAFAPDSFEGIGPDVVLNLENNLVNSLPEAIFRPVLDSAAGLKVGGRDCPVVGPCSNLVLNCDQKSGWLCGNKTHYEPKLEGFLCRNPYGSDIWDWCESGTGVKLI